MAEGGVLVIGCGALVRELEAIAAGFAGMDVECLPARLHNTPERITTAVIARVQRALPRYRTVVVGYADCGTGGRLDAALAELGVERLPGAHCYEFYAGTDRFREMHEEEPGTFYLTDYLTRHFERLVWEGLGLDRAPSLRDEYFRNYRRLVYLSQEPTPELEAAARSAAERLGLAFEHRPTGLDGLRAALAASVGAA